MEVITAYSTHEGNVDYAYGNIPHIGDVERSRTTPVPDGTINFLETGNIEAVKKFITSILGENL